MYSRSLRTENKICNDSPPSYQMLKVPDKRGKKLSVRSYSITHILVRRLARQLYFTKCNVPKHASSNSSITIISHSPITLPCWDVLYSRLPDIPWPPSLPPPSCLCLVGMLSLLLVSLRPFFKVLIRGWYYYRQPKGHKSEFLEAVVVHHIFLSQILSKF